MPANEIPLRAPSAGEAQAICDLLNARSIALHGEPEFTLDDVVAMWGGPGFDLARDARVATDPEGRIVGYVWSDAWRTSSEIEFEGHVHPDRLGRGIGTALADWAESRADEVVANSAPGSGSVLRHFLWSDDEAGRALIGSRGYEIVRLFYEMTIILSPSLSEPVWPEGVRMRTLGEEEDAHALHDATEEAFADHWGFVPHAFEEFSSWHLERENFDPSLLFIAEDGGEIAGSALCRAPAPSGPKDAWVGALSIRKPWRRRGIALALLLTAFGELRRHGYERVSLGVDTENATGALDLYVKAGMRVRHEAVCYEKRLR